MKIIIIYTIVSLSIITIGAMTYQPDRPYWYRVGVTDAERSRCNEMLEDFRSRAYSPAEPYITAVVADHCSKEYQQQIALEYKRRYE